MDEKTETETPKTQTMIVFDGDFHEKQIPWKPLDESMSYADYLEANGFSRYEQWSTEDESDRSARRIIVWNNDGGPANRWLVEVVSADEGIEFLIEGNVNYLRFMASPLCVDVQIYHHIQAIQATIARAFQVYHGHDAPDHAFDHLLDHSCRECDPHGEWARKGELKEHHEFQERRRELREWARTTSSSLTADDWKVVDRRQSPKGKEWDPEHCVALFRYSRFIEEDAPGRLLDALCGTAEPDIAGLSEDDQIVAKGWSLLHNESISGLATFIRERRQRKAEESGRKPEETQGATDATP